MAGLILIRHAHARWSQDEMRPLSSQGRKASCDLARDLERLSISRIVSSPYLRAIQTVERLATMTGLRVEIDDDLRERKLAEDPVPDFEQAVRKTWDDFDFRHPGGETSRTAQRRIVDGIARHLTEQPEDTTAVSTHGNVLALYLNSLDRSLGFAFWRQLSMPDAGAFMPRKKANSYSVVLSSGRE